MRPSLSSTRLAVPAFPDSYGPRYIRGHSGSRSTLRSGREPRLVLTLKRTLLTVVVLIAASVIAAASPVSAGDRSCTIQGTNGDDQLRSVEWRPALDIPRAGRTFASP